MAQAIPYLIIAATAVSAGSAIQEGKAKDRMARFQARQLEREGKREFAKGTREQQEILRQGRILESNTRAQMAGSGGVTTDPGATNTIGELNAEVAYNGLAAMYDATSKAQGRRFQAAAKRVEGHNAKVASRWKALSTALSGSADAAGAF